MAGRRGLTDLSTGIHYTSIAEASKALGVSDSVVYSAMRPDNRGKLRG